jgi:hypothetical protein
MLSFVQAYYRFADTMDPDVWFEPSEVMCILNLDNMLSFHINTLVSLKTLCILADLNPYDSAYLLPVIELFGCCYMYLMHFMFALKIACCNTVDGEGRRE